MSKRKAAELASTEEPTVAAAGRPGRAKRVSSAAATSSAGASTNAPSAAASTAATAAASASVPGVDEDGDAEMSKPAVRRGGRVAAVNELRPAQKLAMSHVATVASHGVDCPSWYGFKQLPFVQKRAAAIGPGRQWRNFKQIVERENYHLMEAHVPTYTSMRSAPSSLPSHKYCDLTGFPARYTDPKTHLHYYSAREYQKIKHMHTETIKQMLEIRGQTPSHQLMLR